MFKSIVKIGVGIAIGVVSTIVYKGRCGKNINTTSTISNFK